MEAKNLRPEALKKQRLFCLTKRMEYGEHPWTWMPAAGDEGFESWLPFLFSRK